MICKDNPSHAGEGNTHMLKRGRWNNIIYKQSRQDASIFTYEYCDKMYHNFWDVSNPETKVLCSKNPIDVLCRWKPWHIYWSSKYCDATIYYICMIRDVKYHSISI